MSTASTTESDRENCASAAESRSREARAAEPGVVVDLPDLSGQGGVAGAHGGRGVLRRERLRGAVVRLREGGAVQEPGLEALREEEDVLAPAHGVEDAADAAQRGHQLGRAAAEQLVVGLAPQRLHVAHGVLERRRPLGPVVGAARHAGLGRTRVREREDQRIRARMDQRRDAQRVERRGELAAVPREVDQQLPAGVDRERAHGGEVVLLHGSRRRSRARRRGRGTRPEALE